MNNELATKNNEVQKIIDQAPAFFDMSGSTGFEDFDSSSVAIPFLKIVQPTTKGLPDDVPMGTFYSPATGKNYGKSVNLICVGFYRSFIHRDAGEGADAKFLGSITPEEFTRIESTLTKDGGKYVNSKGEKYSDCRNHFILNADDLDSGIMLWTMESTGIGTSKAWNSRIQSVKMKTQNGVAQAPIYAKIWELSTEKMENDKGKYYVVNQKTINDKGWIPTKEQADLVKAAFAEVQELKGRGVKITEAKESDDDDDGVPF